MRFSKIVVAALSVPLCVDGNRKHEATEETNVASFEGVHFGDEKNHLSMDDGLVALPSLWDDDGDLAPIDYDAWTQATELRNPEYEIRDASRSDDDDDDFAIDIGVLSMERKLSTECASYPVVNETGQLSAWDFDQQSGGFQYLVYHCYSDSPRPELCPDKYSVPLKCWNTSLITDLSYALHELTAFNDEISSWDTGSVTDLSWTFFGASSFNSDISSWDTGKVTDMRATFWEAYSFNSDISSWDTGNVTTLMLTFFGASSFNSDISSWDIRKVKDMRFTFSGAYYFNSDISSWETGKVKDLSWTFNNAYYFNSDISSWNTEKVTSLYETFYNAYSFNADISSWNTGKVTSMYGTFYAATSFNVDISAWDTGNVKDMSNMLKVAFKFNQCLGGWAAKTPSNVSTFSMLTGSACPNQSTPDPKKGPWCQGFDERCFGACSDAEEFRFGENEKSCKFIREITAPTEKELKQKLRRVCKRKAFPGEGAKGKKIRVRDVCQKACGKRGFGPGKKCDKFS